MAKDKIEKTVNDLVKGSSAGKSILGAAIKGVIAAAPVVAAMLLKKK